MSALFDVLMYVAFGSYAAGSMVLLLGWTALALGRAR